MSWQIACASISVLLGYPLVGALLGYGLSAVLAEELAELSGSGSVATSPRGTSALRGTTSLWTALSRGQPLIPAVRRGMSLGALVGISALVVNWLFQLWPWNPWLPPGQHLWMCC